MTVHPSFVDTCNHLQDSIEQPKLTLAKCDSSKMTTLRKPLVQFVTHKNPHPAYFSAKQTANESELIQNFVVTGIVL